MAKVTEQDLIDRGFKQVENNFYITILHPILDSIHIEIYLDIIYMTVGYKITYTEPLTHSNLDLFIRFAKGEKL